MSGTRYVTQGQLVNLRPTDATSGQSTRYNETLSLPLPLALTLTLTLTLTPHCAAQPRARHATTPAYGAARSAHPPQQALTAPPTLARAHRRR